ncbi:hypothetical protein HGQ17_00400 [Nesterenkonia sp. MY13]|uniref:Uncharacterized protein n=1 Tax=Nesterenkonia sedimenti TaxID=1463632 RepID=A0A7X8TGV6_9MICC|nr:hypothetical protein [Nesterenkonia sedimenti]NLS08489.1 hypothetical protein [Nesterenkonia sedimenti]
MSQETQSSHNRWVLVVLVLIVAAIELAATIGSFGAEPMELVPGWAPTRPTDSWAITLTLAGAAGLITVGRWPLVGLATTAGAYAAFILRDYEFGMTLPAMVAVFIVVQRGKHRLMALFAALVCLGATLAWIVQRTTTIDEGGVVILAWVAFGTVSAVFFLLPVLLGELLRLRRVVKQDSFALEA